MGTLKPKSPFMPEFFDCPTLHKILTDTGKPDEASIIKLLSERTNLQRQQLSYYYKKMFDKDLLEIFEERMKGDYLTLVRTAMMPAQEYDANELKRALKKERKEENIIIEILCSRSNNQRDRIKRAYKELHHAELWEDVSSSTSGELRDFLVDLCKEPRLDDHHLSEEQAAAYAKKLTETDWVGEGSFFRCLLTTHSHESLCSVFKAYEELNERTIEETIEKLKDKRLDKNYKSTCLAIVKMARNTPEYFAEKLHWSMKGLGTNDKALIRLVCTRCEVDMVQIKEEFQKKYTQTLEDFIDDDTKGNYRLLLLSLVGSPDFVSKASSFRKSLVR